MNIKTISLVFLSLYLFASKNIIMQTITFLAAHVQHEDTFIRLMTDFYKIDDYPIDVQKTRQNFRYILNHPTQAKIFMITQNTEVVGYFIINYLFSFEFGGIIAFLDELYVDGKMRGTGVGKKALAFIHQLAEKEELKQLYLEIEPHNKPAQALYEKSGWVKHHRALMRFCP